MNNEKKTGSVFGLGVELFILVYLEVSDVLKHAQLFM